MTKEELVIQLEHTKNSFIIGLAALSVFDSGQAVPLLEHHVAAFGDYTIPFNQVAELLKKQPDCGIALSEFNKMLMRTTLKETFEHIKEYCTETEQYDIFKKQNWYEFARMIRNFLSHNCHFIFNKYDRDRLPIKYGDIEIIEEMNGKGLGDYVFGNTETWELFTAMEAFVSSELK